tara:strand:+ start:131 stop:640 length:510 start_codon:yes stop_codon:yes gene_type:complete
MSDGVCQWEDCRKSKYNQGINTNYCRAHMGKFCNYDNCNEIVEGEVIYCDLHQKSIIKEQELDYIESLEKRANLDKIIISTGDIKSKYSIIDTIMVFDYEVAGLFKGVEPKDAFESVKEHMRAVAVEKGGNAVINCQFQFRYAVSTKLLFFAQAFELYAYGTVVRINEK